MPLRYLVVMTCLLCLVSMSIQADTVVLDNGDRLSGSLVRLDGDELSFRQEATAATLSIGWDRITSITTDEPVRVLLDDGTEISGRIITGDGDRLRVMSRNLDAPAIFPMTAVQRISGLDEPARDRVRTSGNIAVGGTLTRGNTRTERYSASGDFEARTNVNRFRLAGEVNKAKEDGNVSQDNATTAARYDHFLSERVYANSSVTLSKDRLRDLRLRTSAGAGLGYQILDTEQRSLSVEAGASYVNQDFYEAENESNPAARWALDYQERLFARTIRLFHNQEGLQSVDSSDDLLLRTRTGVRFPLVLGMTGTLQVNIDYNKTPPEDQSSTDSAYVATIGYSW